MEAGEPFTDVGERAAQLVHFPDDRCYFAVRGEGPVAMFGNVPEPPVPADGQVLRPLVGLRKPCGHLVTGRFSLLERRVATLLGEQEIGVNPIPIPIHPPPGRVDAAAGDASDRRGILDADECIEPPSTEAALELIGQFSDLGEPEGLRRAGRPALGTRLGDPDLEEASGELAGGCSPAMIS